MGKLNMQNILLCNVRKYLQVSKWVSRQVLVRCGTSIIEAQDVCIWYNIHGLGYRNCKTDVRILCDVISSDRTARHRFLIYIFIKERISHILYYVHSILNRCAYNCTLNSFQLSNSKSQLFRPLRDCVVFCIYVLYKSSGGQTVRKQNEHLYINVCVCVRVCVCV